MAIKGTPGNDNLDGTSGDDLFKLFQGGDDTATGDGGDDQFFLRDTLTAADQLDGGAARDKLILNGDYSSGLTFGASTIVNIENIILRGAHDYSLTTNDANVAAAHLLTVNANTLGAGHKLTFDGSAETDGRFLIIGGAGDDRLTGGDGRDTFDLTHGGNDTAHGGAGRDTFNTGAAFNPLDVIDGGVGDDTLTLNGNYSPSPDFSSIVFNANTISNIETLNLLGAANEYHLVMNDGNVHGRHSLTVDASGAYDLWFEGQNESHSAFDVIVSPGSNDIQTGGGNDIIDDSAGGYGLFKGGDGTDIFAFTAARTAGVNVHGDEGNDTFDFGATLSSGDFVFGGGGNDTLALNGAYSLTFGPQTVTGVETITLADGYGYVLTSDDATVAAGATLTVDGSAIGVSGNMGFDGTAETDGHFHFKVGGCFFLGVEGGALADTYDILGSNFIAIFAGNGGNDVFNLGAGYAPTSRFDGGADFDTAVFDGDYSSGLIIDQSSTSIPFPSTTGFYNMEAFTFTGGHSYTVYVNGDVTSGGGALTFDATGLGVADVLSLDLRSATSGPNSVTGGAGDDIVTIGAKSVLLAAQIDGDAGNDTLVLDGDYSGGATTLDSTFLADFEKMTFTDGHTYNFRCVDTFIGAGQTFTIDGTALTGANTMLFNGSFDSDGAYVLKGGAGADTLIGGAVHDVITAGGGNDTINGTFDADTLTGGLGADTFSYFSISDSFDDTYDTITDMNFDADIVQILAGTTPTAIDAGVAGTANADNFVNDLVAAVGAGQMAAGDAVLWTPDDGDLSGHSYLVIDRNGSAGYQVSADMVIEVTGYTGTLDANDILH